MAITFLGIDKKTKQKKWYIEVTICYDSNGKRVAKRETYRGLKSEALLRENELKQLIKNGTTTSLTDITFNQFIDKWYKDESINLQLSTISGYISLLSIIRRELGHLKLKDIKPIHLLDFYTTIRIGSGKRKISENTVLHYYALIQRLFNLAVKWQFIISNPNSCIDRPKIVKKEVEFYTDKQLSILLNNVDNECLKYQVIIYLAVDSGARRGELTGLEWSDIDFEKKTISINKTTQNINRKIIQKCTPKNNSSIRTITLTDKTLNILENYKLEQEQLSHLLGNKWVNTNKVLINNCGDLMHPDTPSKIFNKLCKKYNLPHIKFHGLRHSNASLLIHRGIHTKNISKRLGHSSSATTDLIYSHLYTRYDTAATECLNNFLQNKTICD